MADSRIALVTGAGSGIGKAAAHALLEDGWKVIFMGRHEDKLKAAIAESSRSAKGTAIAGDVTDPKSVHNVFTKVQQDFGRLDLLFNNAGVSMPGTAIEDISYDQWKTVVDTNLTGMFLCTQEAVRMFKSQNPRGGRIINNGSIAAHSPRPNSIAYTATKHAVTGLTKSTSLDGRAFDIACGQIDIGNTRTELAANMPRSGPNVEPLFDVQLVGKAVAQMAGLPLDTNVLFMTIMATKMPFVGRG
jgi:NAD(P)-dependent dehydrogenase (short-subunit alcohol dehydrogenase family)